jgi:hypothetical protein
MPDFNESSELAPSPANQTIPQFSTAEYSQNPGVEHCLICSNLISGVYYRVNGQMACENCARQISEGQPIDSHAAFVRGLLLGIGAAVVGLVAYATFTIVTGWFLGYIALGVGWFVAKAIMKGSNGIGGRRYQVTAVLLTYAAISLASIPILISYGVKQRNTSTHPSTSIGQPRPSNSAIASGQNAQPDPSVPVRKINWTAAIGQLAFFGVASPFLQLRDPLHGAIGLFILFIGLRIAWKLTTARRLNVDGPYSASAS